MESYAEAQGRAMRARADMRELELQKMKGSLVPREEFEQVKLQRDKIAAQDHPLWARILQAVGGDDSFGRTRCVEAVEALARRAAELEAELKSWKRSARQGEPS